jgi:hypothetical protein
MKLLRYGPPGQEKPGLLDRDGKIRDLSATLRDIDGEALSPAALDRLRRLDPASLPLVSGSPARPCVGQISRCWRSPTTDCTRRKPACRSRRSRSSS